MWKINGNKFNSISEMADVLGFSKQYLSRSLIKGKTNYFRYGKEWKITNTPPKHGFQFTDLETGEKSEIYETISDPAKGIGMSYQTFYRNQTWPKLVRKKGKKYEFAAV